MDQFAKLAYSGGVELALLNGVMRIESGDEVGDDNLGFIGIFERSSMDIVAFGSWKG